MTKEQLKALPLLLDEVERLQKALDQAIEIARFGVNGDNVGACAFGGAGSRLAPELAAHLRSKHAQIKEEK